jgi:polar amino acid transport system substrate-binding protein
MKLREFLLLFSVLNLGLWTDGAMPSRALSSFASAAESAGELRWAADAKSGAPYVFVDPDHPDQFRGFEYDMLQKIAQAMGKKLVVVQNEWDSLIPGLERGDYEVAANGIEITPERSEVALFSDPYYATFEQLIVRAEDPSIQGIEHLGGKRIGTLKSSLAHHILERKTSAQIVFYEAESNGYQDVASGRIDGFFADYPIALYYAFPNPKLRAAGPPEGRMRYGIAVSKKKPELLRSINQAIRQLRESGELESILSKWNLLHPFVVSDMGLRGAPVNDPDELKKVSEMQAKSLSLGERLVRYRNLLPLLLKGAWTSMKISLLSMGVAILFGLFLALSRIYGSPLTSLASQWLIEVLRGTPLLIQLYLIFFGLPHLGLHLTPFSAAVLGLGINYGAYEAENYRAGIEAVPKSQIEAAHALALSPTQRFVYVVLPQAYRIILPPMTNDFISLIKDSSLVSVITMVELTTIYSQLASTYFDHLGLGVLVAAIYFAMGYPFVRLARKLESNLKRKLST